MARWSATLAALLTPLAMRGVSADWHWTIGDFVVAAIPIATVGLLYEFAEEARAGLIGVASQSCRLPAIAIATAPSTAHMVDGALRALPFGSVFCALWLLAVAFFRAATKKATP